MQIRDFDFEVKAVDTDGTFTGYDSIFGNIDRGADIVAPGAYADNLAELKAKGRKLPVLWHHQMDRPIGVYEKLQEDDRGLYVEGRLLTKDVALAREAASLIRAGAVTGLSIGYTVKHATVDQMTGVRTLHKLGLEELSIVTAPMNDDARIDAIKMKLAYGELPTLSEFERFLRDSGMSRSKAAAIASLGLKPLLSESEVPANETAHALVEALQGFSLPKI